LGILWAPCGDEVGRLVHILDGFWGIVWTAGGDNDKRLCNFFGFLGDSVDSRLFK